MKPTAITEVSTRKWSVLPSKPSMAPLRYAESSALLAGFAEPEIPALPFIDYINRMGWPGFAVFDAVFINYRYKSNFKLSAAALAMEFVEDLKPCFF